MGPNQKLSDGLAILGVIDAISTTTTVSSGWVSMQNFERLLAVIDVGVFGASATVNALLNQATTSGGAGSKAITGKAITQLVAATGNSQQAMINCADQELDLANGFGFVQLQITVATAASVVAGILLGGVPDFEPPVDASASPAINLGLSTVQQIVP